MIIDVYYIQFAKIAKIIELRAYRVAFFDIFIICHDMTKGSAPIDALPSSGFLKEFLAKPSGKAERKGVIRSDRACGSRKLSDVTPNADSAYRSIVR